MKVIFTFFALIFVSSLFGQFRKGTYESSKSYTISSEPMWDNFEILFLEQGEFVYKYRTSMGCALWYDIKGSWHTNNDTLVLVDTVRCRKKVQLTSSCSKSHYDKIRVLVESASGGKMPNIKIQYNLKDSRDTLTGFTDVGGIFEIDKNDKIYENSQYFRKRNSKVEISILYVDAFGAKYTSSCQVEKSSQVNFVVEDERRYMHLVERSTFFKVNQDSLFYLKEEFNQKNMIPLIWINSYFKFSK